MSLNLDSVAVLDANRGDLEQRKFVQDSEGNIALRTFSIGDLLSGISYDSITVAYPSDSVETYTYKTGGVSGTTVATITVTYVSSAKTQLVSVVRT